MNCAVKEIKKLREIIEGEIRNKNVFLILDQMLDLAKNLEKYESSSEFHNFLKGFIYLWSDEFAPAEDKVNPIINKLFKLHGFPDDISKAK